ncbi:MAG TPA: thiolase domain-containing protein [Anaerolinea thermolimosa]|uniref:Thiolase domain-containing protein n=1 Tax=Anaerolinea thermolimosa TaxID=229919 RepID=A0A3D1JGZ3_9CHLR|nr:thiolase domain-containing protein [Anaerolinea thermolimosa]
MPEVVIAGTGLIPAGEHWELSLRSQATRALLAAKKDAGGLEPQALYIGNFLASTVSHQSNLGALLTDWSNHRGIEGFTVEAAEASGGGAFRMGYLAVASGLVDVAAVVGVEKVTDVVGPGLENAIAEGMDYDFEAAQGLTLAGQAALVMRRYMHTYRVPRQVFAGFPMLAHENAVGNPHAMFRRPISLKAYEEAAMVCDPLGLFDMAPYADGAAAVILTRPELARATAGRALVRVSGSAVVIDTLALHDRPDPLAFDAARISVQRACRQAGITPQDVDFFELTDSFSIYAALSLEAAGFALPGKGWELLQDGTLRRDGKLPIQTMGGFKARGNPLGASGVYQIVEAVRQLRGEAGACQVAGAKRALVQNLAGPASTAVTHVLERWEPKG